MPHQNAAEYQPYTEELGASQQITVQPGANQQITKHPSTIDNNVRKEDPMTWRNTVSGQLKKYLSCKDLLQLKKIFFHEIVVVAAFLNIIAKYYYQMGTM